MNDEVISTIKTKDAVTVVTSSIGRPQLKQCIESVKAQTVQCKHLIFINGEKFHDEARKVLSEYPEIEVHYIREETGDCGIGPGYSDVFSAAPYLTRSEFIFFLNDDDWYEPNHVASLLEPMIQHKCGWAYGLRRYVDLEGKPICDDDFDSLGFWPCVYDPHGGRAIKSFLVDNSCFGVRRALAIKCGWAWHVPVIGDRVFLNALKECSVPAACSGLITVNYRVGVGIGGNTDPRYYELNTKAIHKRYPDGFPWRERKLFIPEKKEETK